MEEPYDYSQHKYCITLAFEYNVITSGIVAIDKIGSNELSHDQITHKASFLYNIITENVIARDDLVDRILEHPAGLPKSDVHIPNIFSELKRNYSNDFRPKSYRDAARYETFIHEAIEVLQKIPREWKKDKKCLDTDFYYAVIIPSNWEYQTREEFFRPLLIKAGLIHKDDGQGRLIFFSKVEPLFHHMQESPDLLRNVEIKAGDQFVICTLDCQDTFRVNLELISAQYPVFTVTESKWVPQSLKQVRFAMPLGLMELKSYGKELYYAGILSMIIDQSDQNFEKKIIDASSYTDVPFDILPINPYNLGRRKVDTTQDTTELLDHEPSFIDQIFNNEMDTLLQGTSNIKTRSMVIFSTKQARSCSHWEPLLILIQSRLKAYRDQKQSYTLISNRETFDFHSIQSSGILDLVTYQIQVFNMRRAPVILPKDTEYRYSRSYSRPIIFINIDISLSQTKTTITYLNEVRQIEQKNLFECNMEPLGSFITYSKQDQRPILHINNRLKLLLDNIFGDYISLFSTSNKQSMTRRMLLGITSILLDQVSQEMHESFISYFYKMKSSKNPSKETRNLFASSNPNLFKQLTENVKTNDLFTSTNGKFWGADNDSFTTCHPGYIFFFVATYLHTLSKLLEDKIKNEVGISWQFWRGRQNWQDYRSWLLWRSNNIWYGVSIDKNLLDTVFGSIKNLEKLFFACGILQKDDKFLRAKFCTRGEDILPAIQQKLMDLEFKIKSYFVVAQVFSKHIQLTLHQVVVLTSSKKDAATIIIQDEILYIDDVYDSLCKTLWTNIQSNYQVNYCVIHKYIRNVQYDLCSFQGYSNIRQNLQLCVKKLLERNKASVDMNSKIQLNINSKCSCSIDVFLRDIIEVGFMTVIENMATIIAGSLTNKELFGNYVANYIFVFGDPFNLSYGSMLHTTYVMLLQKAIDDAVQFKEKDTMTFVLGESLCQLLELVTRTKPYMFEKFITGTLCRVSSETFALMIQKRATSDNVYSFRYFPFFRINRTGDIKNIIKADGNYFVFIQKGEPVPTKSFKIQHELVCEYSSLVILKAVDSSGDVVSKQYSELDKNTAGTTYHIPADLGSEVSKITIDCKHFKHTLSLKVLRASMNSTSENYGFPFDRSLNFIDPLTLAYI